jgi:Ca2+-binding RTX toxin-like protein
LFVWLLLGAGGSRRFGVSARSYHNNGKERQMAKITNFMHHLNKIAFLLGVVLVSVTTSAWGQPAPALRAVVPADAAPEAMSQLFAELGDGERTISVPGAAWLQLQFSEVRLGPDGVLTIIDALGESQTFSQAQIDAWGGLSAAFNGSELHVRLRPGQGATKPVSARIKDVIIGLPASAVSGAEVVIPQPLRNLLGPDINRFIPDDLHGLRKEGAALRQGAGTEAICGSTDDRIASANPRAGRIMPIGCTGWLIDGGNLLTAGHCFGSTTPQTVQFNVPASQADGTTVAPPVRDQYPVIATSIVRQDGGVGNDWAVFQVSPNTETGLMPAAAQGATFQLSNTDNPGQVRVTGYGVDDNTQNQTQQTHVGTLLQNTGGATSGVLQYDTDTQGGNSGSPVIVEGGNIAIGIHTHGGCTSTGGANNGTSFRNAALWTAVNTATQTYTLTVTKAGLGSGTITSSLTGINCGTTCSASYATSTSVTLTATPMAGSVFSGWSGAGCTGIGSCTVIMDAAKSITATFTQTFTLTITKGGNGLGTVTSSPLGISCDPDCTEPYVANTGVALTAAPAPGSTFTGWSNNCSGPFTMSAAKTCTATFMMEVCDGRDNDLDGLIDEGFPDTDKDGIADCVDSSPKGFCHGAIVTILGTPGIDNLTGTAGNDVIEGLAGNDVIYGLAGNDTICGGDGDDSMDGGLGTDTMYGNAGNDTLHGRENEDLMYGQDGNDTLNGGPANDTLNGGAGNDSLYGRENNDILYGRDGNDALFGGIGYDQCRGDTGTDTADSVNCEIISGVP